MQSPATFITCSYESHSNSILEILNDAIINSTALYDYLPREAETMVDWFNKKQASNFPVIGVVNEAQQLMGFATYGTFRAWPANKYSIEHSVYIHESHRGKGLARQLMKKLIETAKQQQYHTIIAGIDIENESSIALHKKLGFVHVGTFKDVAYKFDRWLDLSMYQLILSTPKKPVGN